MKPEYSKMIDQLYIEMFDMLISYARCSFEEESLAEEAVQETFQIACQKPDKLCESLNPKGWLVNTLKFTICNMKRSREHARQILSAYLIEQQESITFSEDKLCLQLMYEDISHSEEYRLIKEMAIDGKSHLEMANARGISVSACKKRVQRAKEILKDCSGMLGYNDYYHSGHIEYNGTIGRYYKAYVCIWAGKNGDGDSRYFWTYPEKATLFAG